jgi:hypothetical protein
MANANDPTPQHFKVLGTKETHIRRELAVDETYAGTYDLHIPSD